MTETSDEQVGTGRRHGERPAGGMELRLYEATHGSTSERAAWYVDLVTDLIVWYYTLPGCSTGGSLHVVLDDLNLEDECIAWCGDYASACGDTCGSELASLLGRMSVWDRVHAVELAHDRMAEDL